MAIVAESEYAPSWTSSLDTIRSASRLHHQSIYHFGNTETGNIVGLREYLAMKMGRNDKLIPVVACAPLVYTRSTLQYLNAHLDNT